jgi:pyrrolidone-carboxylate peptidase
LLSHYQNSKTKVGFVHIPYATLQKKEPSMELPQMVKGLTVAIENME